MEVQVAGKIVRPRQQGGEGGGIREIPVRQLFQTVFEVREGFEPILFGGFDDAIDDRTGLRPARRIGK